MMLRLTLILALVLAGCSDAPADVPRRTMNERRNDAIAISKQPPQQTSHQLRNGELIVLDVPVVVAPGFSDVQKCFLWRDSEFKTASLQCPSEATGPALAGGPTADGHSP